MSDHDDRRRGAGPDPTGTDDAEAFATKGPEPTSRALGDDNPETLRATFDLAWLRPKQRRYDEAEALEARVRRNRGS